MHCAASQVIALRERSFVIDPFAELIDWFCFGLQCAAAGVEALDAFHVGFEFEEGAQPFVKLGRPPNGRRESSLRRVSVS